MQFSGFTKLVFVLGFIAVVWLVLLPWLSSFDMVEEQSKRNWEAGIDPGAVFYTEHPAARDLNRSIEHKIMTNEDAFWESR